MEVNYKFWEDLLRYWVSDIGLFRIVIMGIMRGDVVG